MKKYFITIILMAIIFPVFVFASQTADDQIQVRIMNVNGDTKKVIYPFEPSYRGTASIVVGDLGRDGVEEIVIGAGAGNASDIIIYRQDGSVIRSFEAYGKNYLGGVNVAIGDVDGNGVSEIITSPMYGGGPHIRVFDGYGNMKAQFFAYDDSFLGGVNIASGDINNDGVDEVITGPGTLGGPHIKIFFGTGSLMSEKFVGSAQEISGARVAMLDINGDGDDELITSDAAYGDPTVQLYDWLNDELTFVLALPNSQYENTSVHVFGGDVDGDGMEEIGVGSDADSSKIEFYEMNGRKTLGLYDTFALPSVIAGVFEGSNAMIFALATEQQSKATPEYKHIYVDISRQTLFAYEYGTLVKAFLVSTGRDASPSPTGSFDITKKILWKDYIWDYGDGDPRNYNIPNVQYNLQFQPIYYIHYAYWHINFGTKMSGGCVNTSYNDAEWIYYWANVGVPVELY